MTFVCARWLKFWSIIFLPIDFFSKMLCKPDIVNPTKVCIRLCCFTLTCHIEPFHSYEWSLSWWWFDLQRNISSLNKVLSIISFLLLQISVIIVYASIILYFSCKLKYLTEFNKIKIARVCFHQNENDLADIFREFVILNRPWSIGDMSQCAFTFIVSANYTNHSTSFYELLGI